MSATTFAGSAQFAAASILGAGGGVVSAILAASLLNARYAPISVSVAPIFLGGPLRRLLRVAADRRRVLGDVPAPGRPLRPAAPDRGRPPPLRLWVGGTAVGVLLGDQLGDPSDLGLDAAFPALFLALLVTQVHSRRALAAAVLGGTIALLLLPIAPAGVPIIAAAAASLLGWRRS